ncbi:MAG: hypothetical protein FJ241_11820 [Nitrospira sp.]|nr:hypothetical protein [Nitrospira sp.]
MQFQYNDGGRAEAGYKGTTGDCAVRAIAIVTGKPYQEVYDLVNQYGAMERMSKKRRSKGKSNARTGVWKETIRKIMLNLGYKWTPTMSIGSGCKVHLRKEELPTGRLLVNVSRHYVAVIDGIVNDTYDCTRGGSRCVYGYYSL